MCLGVPGEIKEIYQNGVLRMAKVDFGGVTREVCIETLPEARIGDYTIVHAGFALNLLSLDEARATLETLKELAEFQQSLELETGVDSGLDS